MQKKAKKITLSRETLRHLEAVELSGPAGGLAVVGDTDDRRCEPSIVSCKETC